MSTTTNPLTKSVFCLGTLYALMGASSCIAVDSDLLEVTEGCDELSEGAVAEAEVDARVRELMLATLDLERVSHETEDEVFQACSAIALDFGAESTWNGLEAKARITNAEGSGACDVALAEIDATLDLAAQAEANVALAITEGACYPDFELQTSCEAACAANTECTPGTIETRCEPADLSVQCQAECAAEAHCEGTPELPANCMGKCEAACQGECKGTCIAPNGTKTENDPMCMGKCSSGCNGLCRGLCKVDAPEGIDCGAEVSCRGGCTGDFTEPQCTSELIPPSCTIDDDCYASCAAQANANAICEPPRVEVYADVSVMADGRLEILIDTLQTNLPTLIAVAETKGELAVKAANRMAEAAEELAEDAGALEGKSLACAGASAELTVEAAVRLEASFEASGSIVATSHDKTQ